MMIEITMTRLELTQLIVLFVIFIITIYFMSDLYEKYLKWKLNKEGE